MHDEGRVVAEGRDQADVRLGQVQAHGQVVDLLDGAVDRPEQFADLLLLHDRAVLLGHVANEGLLALLLDDHLHAAGHRVAGHMRLAPAGDVEHHVVGVELVAIVPRRVRPQVQDVFGGVVVDLPALEQPGLEGEVGRVADQRLAEGPGLVAFLRPVEDPRVVHAHGLLGDPDRTAGHRLLSRRPLRDREAEHAVGGCGGRTQSRGRGEELAPVELARQRRRRQLDQLRVQRLPVDGFACHVVSLFSCTGPCSIGDRIRLGVNCSARRTPPACG